MYFSPTVCRSKIKITIKLPRYSPIYRCHDDIKICQVVGVFFLKTNNNLTFIKKRMEFTRMGKSVEFYSRVTTKHTAPCEYSHHYMLPE